jgi:hypothetical protein
MDPSNAERCKPVDAKYLVLQVIASGHLKACGRNLVDSDVAAIDQHMRRCNLGRFRLSTLVRLQKEVAAASSLAEAAAAQQKLMSEQESARKQFRKLQHIQNHRLKDLKKKTGKKTKNNNVQNRGPNVLKEKTVEDADTAARSQQIILAADHKRSLLASPYAVPRVMKWADASEDVVDLVAGSRGLNMSWFENLQHWRSSTESAKGDELMSRRVENACWRLWASGASPSLCTSDFLLELDKKNVAPYIKLTRTSEAPSGGGRGRQQPDLGIVLKNEGLCLDRPSVMLQNWRISTKEAKVLLDGQARSRTENQLWRLMAISKGGDSKSRAIIQKISGSNPTLALHLGVHSPVALGATPPVSRTPSPGFACQPLFFPREASPHMSSPGNVGRMWLRTPSPECRWTPTSRPVRILSPRPPAESQGFGLQPPAAVQSQRCYMQPMPVRLSQFVGIVADAPMQTGIAIQPVAAMSTMAVPLMTNAMNTSGFVCVALP